jgi:hypothetical protein
MATVSESVELFDWLADDQLEELVVKLNRLPTGKEFERRAEEAMADAIDIDRIYKEIVDDYGDLVGYVDDQEKNLPWWLLSFAWTVEADPVDPIEIDKNNLDEFENYPLDSTRIEKIELKETQSLRDGLDAFATLEEKLSSELDYDVTKIAPDVGFNPRDYDLPDRLFMIPESGRISTSDEFKEWFEKMLNLCPPASPELTALFRVNANIPRQHAVKVLSPEQIQRLVDLSVLESSSEGDEKTYSEEYDNSLSQLLKIEPPFDIDIEVSNDKNRLTDLQYAYYRAWADDTDRLSQEQKWLRAAKNKEPISDSEIYKYAEYAFRTPTKLDKYNNLVFESASSSLDRDQIATLLEEHGHPVNDD